MEQPIANTVTETITEKGESLVEHLCSVQEEPMLNGSNSQKRNICTLQNDLDFF